MLTKRIFYTPVFALMLPMLSNASEVAPIRITNVEGSLTFAYSEDTQETHLPGEAATTENRLSFEQALYVNTKGYVYHPKLLSFELGLGPQLVQNELNAGAEHYYQSESLYNINAALDILPDKPYPLKLSYYKEHPTTSASLDDLYEQESVHYGVNFQLKKPLLPINLVIDHNRQEMQGEGFERSVDENIDQTMVRTYFPSGLNGHQQLILTSTEVNSSSRFRTDPVSPVNYTTKNISYDSNLYFGKKDNIRVTNLFALTDQSGVRDYQELRFSPALRILHSKKTESFYKLNYVNNDQVTIQSINQYVSTGIRHALSDTIDINGELNSNHDETTGLSNINNSASASINYHYDFTDGRVSLNGGFRTDYIDRNVTSNVMIKSPITLTPLMPYELSHDYIIASSIKAYPVGSTIALTTYEGDSCTEHPSEIHILVKAIATRTHITYCTTDIEQKDFDIEYEYDPGGSVSYNNQISFIQANLEWKKQHTVFAYFRSNAPYIESGDPILPLDDSINITLGARSSFPLGADRETGAEYTSESHQSSLTPYERNVFDIYYQEPIWRGNLRLSAQKLDTDYLTSSEDVDATRYSIQYRARPSHSMTLSLNYSDTKDLGATTARHTQTADISFNLKVRKFSFGSELRSYNELLGANTQKRSLLRLFVKREF